MISIHHLLQNGKIVLALKSVYTKITYFYTNYMREEGPQAKRTKEQLGKAKRESQEAMLMLDRAAIAREQAREKAAELADFEAGTSDTIPDPKDLKGLEQQTGISTDMSDVVENLTRIAGRAQHTVDSTRRRTGNTGKHTIINPHKGRHAA